MVLHGVTEEQHDDNIRKLMVRAHENGLIFNADKCSLKVEVSTADDMVLHGVTEEQHDDNIRKLMVRAHENGLIFNPDKCSLKVESVMLFGVCMTRLALDQTLPRWKLYEQFLHLDTCVNYRSSLGW